MSHASYGVFPSQTAIRSRSTGDLQKLYFKTTNRAEHDWRTIPDAERPENFDQIHSIGKRTTKYMKYQKKVAPLVDRTACRYTQEFISKPLGDYQCNKELAENFKAVKKPMQAPMADVKSNYREQFAPITTQELRSSKMKTCAPKAVRTKTLGGTDDLLEVESLNHKTYMTPSMEIAKVTPVMIPKPNLTLAGQTVGAEAFRSHYNREFKQNRTAPHGETRWEDYMPEQPPTWVLADDSIYQVRRACFLSPGA